MRIYNSLSRRIEEFKPIDPPRVGMYACGPTVYDFAHIGHGRKYVMDDVLKRTLRRLGYSVTHVMNITDVGHLVSDADEGEDKLEKGAAKFGKTVFEVAEFFTHSFEESMEKLNILPPDVVCKATEHIPEQIAMIKTLMDKGFAYDTPEAVYFSVSKFADYDKLFGQRLKDKMVGARAEVQTETSKQNPADFALWFKRVGKFADHTMHWDSPWGDGFPGWHIECSAMSVKYLGEQFDIHTGGEDHQSVHHPNEIAQSEAASGKKPFVKYWVHHAFLTVNGQKMSKSLGNFYRVEDIEDKGFDPIALRYLYLTVHYRKALNFTWPSLEAVETALHKLRRLMEGYAVSGERTELSEDKLAKINSLREEFNASLADDMNTPQALAVVWQVVKSNIPDYDKYELLRDFDETLGLNLDLRSQISYPKSTSHVVVADLSPEVKELIKQREQLRKEKKWAEADALRSKISDLGYKIEDTETGTKIEKI